MEKKKKKKKIVEETVLLYRSRAHKSLLSSPIPTEFKLDQDFMPVMLTCKLEEAQMKNGCEDFRHCFPHYKYLGFI